MKIYGIIVEVNPFHNGHKYFIEKIKKDYDPDLLIAITSTSFSMRGEISLINKFDKTNLLLKNDIDIVLELPITSTIQNADIFAKNSVNTLKCLGITDLVFGSETTNISLYEKVYSLTKNNLVLNNKENSKKINFYTLLKQLDFTCDEIKLIESPNFTLGFQYIKYLKDNNLNINYHLLQRIKNNYHDKIATSNIASATTIRNEFKHNSDIDELIPYNKELFIDINNSEKNLFNIIKYIYKVNNNYIKTDFLYNEGIQNYIHNNGDFNTNFNDFINQLKNKKYTLSTISRSILHNILETNNIYNLSIDYLRILGISNKGLNYIKTLDKDIKNKLFSSPKEIKNNESIKKILDYELKATSLYEVITNKDIFINEYKLPIRKDK